MKTSELEGAERDYWVVRGLHDFIREIHFTDGGQMLAIRGNDRGRAWDGCFLPSTSWEAASVVPGARVSAGDERHGRGEVVGTAIFGKASAEVEGRGASLRITLLRAFLLHAFGDTVDDEFPHRSQMLLGERAELLGEQSAAATVEDAPLPDGRIGDIGSTERQ